MNGDEPVLELARNWGADFSDIVARMKGQRVSAAHWRHNVPEFPDTPAPFNFVALLLKPAKAERLHGNKVALPGLAQNSLMIAPLGVGGRWNFDSEIETLHVYLPQPLLDLFAKSAQSVQLNDDLDVDDPVISRLMGEFHASMTGDVAELLYADILGVALAARLAERHAIGTKIDRMRTGGVAPHALRRVTDYLMSHLADDVALAELAAIADLSPHHFCRAFKQSTGLPPHAWLTARRVERAQEMIAAHPEMGLTEIALSTGYASQAAFGVAFKRVAGVTPGQWRREQAG